MLYSWKVISIDIISCKKFKLFDVLINNNLLHTIDIEKEKKKKMPKCFFFFLKIENRIKFPRSKFIHTRVKMKTNLTQRGKNKHFTRENYLHFSTSDDEKNSTNFVYSKITQVLQILRFLLHLRRMYAIGSRVYLLPNLQKKKHMECSL